MIVILDFSHPEQCFKLKYNGVKMDSSFFYYTKESVDQPIQKEILRYRAQTDLFSSGVVLN